jgi:hypothetical protein
MNVSDKAKKHGSDSRSRPRERKIDTGREINSKLENGREEVIVGNANRVS